MVEISSEVGSGENAPGITGICATRNFTHLVRGPLFTDKVVPKDVCRCQAVGDVHYRTCDGRMIHYQGECSYILMQTTVNLPDKLVAFSIYIDSKKKHESHRVSWTRLLSFIIDDYKITVRNSENVEVVIYLTWNPLNSTIRFSILPERWMRPCAAEWRSAYEYLWCVYPPVSYGVIIFRSSHTAWGVTSDC